MKFQSTARFDPESSERSVVESSVAGGPVVVGAMGGSGTRAIVDVLTRCDVFMGGRLDTQTGDSLPMRWFLSRHFDQMIRDQVNGTPGATSPAVRRDFRRAIRTHRSGISNPDAAWGWKNPRSMWILPFLVSEFPGLRFIHLVRDGRDMALTTNHFLLDEHSDAILGPTRTGNVLHDQFELWALGNTRAAEDAACSLRGRSLCVRYEDLCSDPADQLRRLFAFLEYDPTGKSIAKISESIKPAKNLGRGRHSILGLRATPSESQRAALKAFGYPEN